MEICDHYIQLSNAEVVNQGRVSRISNEDQLYWALKVLLGEKTVVWILPSALIVLPNPTSALPLSPVNTLATICSLPPSQRAGASSAWRSDPPASQPERWFSLNTPQTKGHPCPSTSHPYNRTRHFTHDFVIVYYLLVSLVHLLSEI